MTRTRHNLIAVAALVAGIGGLIASSPVIRAKVDRHSARWFGWTEEARRADPIGFTNYVEKRLTNELGTLSSRRRELARSTADMNRKISEYERLAVQAGELMNEFRRVHQQAASGSGFPAKVRNASYSQSQLEQQLRLIMSESQGYQQTLVKMRGMQRQSSAQLEQWTLRIDDIEAQLAMLATQRNLLQARELSLEGEQLVAQLNELFHANEQALADNPVRSVRELLADSQAAEQEEISLAAVREFLAAKPEVQDAAANLKPVESLPAATVPVTVTNATPVQQEAVPFAAVQAADGKPNGEASESPKADKPIFSQF